MVFVAILAFAGMRCAGFEEPDDGAVRNARALAQRRHPEIVEVYINCNPAGIRGDGWTQCFADWIDGGTHYVEAYLCRVQRQEQPVEGCVRQ